MMYKRYADDSNQVARVPPPGCRFDNQRRKIVNDGYGLGDDVHDDKRLAVILREIANTVMDGIEMEADFPNNNVDTKMPILDMKVWIDDQQNILYQHYEKPVASKAVLGAQSAQSAACKRSVHAVEMVRRILNTSTKLDWGEYVAPVLTNYLTRMKQAGYGEKYRKSTLLKALGMFDRMKEESEKVLGRCTGLLSGRKKKEGK